MSLSWLIFFPYPWLLAPYAPMPDNFSHVLFSPCLYGCGNKFSFPRLLVFTTPRALRHVRAPQFQLSVSPLHSHFSLMNATLPPPELPVTVVMRSSATAFCGGPLPPPPLVKVLFSLWVSAWWSRLDFPSFYPFPFFLRDSKLSTLFLAPQRFPRSFFFLPPLSRSLSSPSDMETFRVPPL